MNRQAFLELLRRRQPKYLRKTTLREQLDKIMDGGVLTESIEETVGRKLDGIKYAIIGGHAINIHGTSRMTQDIDLLIAPNDRQTVINRLGGSATTLQSPRPDRPIDGISLETNGVIIDLIWIDQKWAIEALNEATPTKYGNVISKPYFILTKLWAGRGEQDDTDIISVLRTMSKNEKEQAIGLVAKYLESDAEDFDQMVAISEM